ncbi:MAG TPA: hypothetical protein VNX21_07410 [Candidatus Thermoplasmatota archaeon]|nr:hypothetical protein [Candidatus Thermoplasmatota archaeon]
MRLLLLAATLTALLAASTGGLAENACIGQMVHTYSGTLSNGNDRVASSEVTLMALYTPNVAVGGARTVHVADSNTEDCNGAGGTPLGGPDGTPFDWDGDHDTGDLGAFFGYGAWAEAPDPCGYHLNLHGPNVAVADFVFGSTVPFLTFEDDQSGPLMVVDPNTGDVTCVTDGIVSASDPDDCISDADPAGPGHQPYYGVGATCGAGGGDGGYWVVLLFPYFEERSGQWHMANPPVHGTIFAS